MRAPQILYTVTILLVMLVAGTHLIIAYQAPSPSTHVTVQSATTSGHVPIATSKPSPTPKPISTHNLYASNPDFIKGLDDECRDDNQKVIKQGFRVGMWAFTGPDKHGHVHVWCKGYYLHGNTRVWWDGVDTTEADDYVQVR